MGISDCVPYRGLPLFGVDANRRAPVLAAGSPHLLRPMLTTTHAPSATGRLLPRVLEHDRAVALRAVARFHAPCPTRLLLATDGSPAADSAVRTARALARRNGASVEIAAIYAPRIPLPASAELRGVERWAPSDRREVAELLRKVRRQLATLLTEASQLREWQLHLEIGDPGPTIVRMASEASTDLIVLGIGVHEPMDRPRGGHTAICVARYATVPLYAAASGCEVPVRCVVALADGRLHAPTIRAALAALLPGSHMWLAMPARTDDNLGTDTDDDMAIDGSESARGLVARVCGPDWAAQVDAIAVERVNLSGDPLTAVLRLADDVDAQLIAIPNHGDPGPVRAFLPNLADPLLLGSRCSVLVVPDHAAGSSLVE